MKSKQSRQGTHATVLEGNWIDTETLCKPGEMKEIEPNVWVVRTGVVLDPPEPIKKPGKGKPRKK